MNTARIPTASDLHRTRSGQDMTVYTLPPRWWKHVPGSASGPQPVREPVAGFHTAGAPVGGPAGAIPSAAGAGAVLTTEWRLLWIVLTLLGIAWACSSCTVMTGNGTGYTYASCAGNAEGMTISPAGASAAKIDNATGAKLATDAVGAVARAYTWGKAFDALGNLIEEGADVIKDGNATDQAINADNNATKETIETFVPPEPAPTIP
jgi:hypothetical protein